MRTTSASCSPNESDPSSGGALARVVLGLVTFASFSLLPSPARADEPRADDPCGTTAKQYVVSPSGSWLNALATCHEREGRTASAWAEYLEAATLAHREKRQEVELAAKHHAKALEPRLTRLVVKVATDADVADLDVRRDGIPMARAAWGTPLPVDPGAHVVTATAPGRKIFTRNVVLKPGAYTTTIDVSALAPSAATPSAAKPAAVSPSTEAVGTTSLTSASYDAPEGSTTNRGGAQRAVGLTLIGVGVAGVALGTYFGLQTLSKSDAAEAACPSSPCADRSAIALNDDAKRAGTISTVSFAAAGGALLVGAIVFFTAPKNGPRVSVATSPTFAGVNVGGAF